MTQIVTFWGIRWTTPTHRLCVGSGFLLGLLAALVSISLVTATVYLFDIDVSSDPPALATSDFISNLVGYVFFAPILETYIVVWLLGRARPYIDSEEWRALVVAVLCALAHFFVHPLSVLGTFFGFYINCRHAIAWDGVLARGTYLGALVPHVTVNAIALGVSELPRP